MSKPAVLVVPASYSLISEYSSLIDAISQAGYEAVGISLLTVGSGSQLTAGRSMYDDAARIAEEAERLADQGKDVVLIGHSYAGVPVSQSTKGLTKAERQKEGKHGGIVHIGYIAAIVPSLGQSLALTTQSGDMPAVDMTVDELGYMCLTDPKQVASFSCQDLPEAEGEALARRFAKHSAQSFMDDLTHAGYIDVPTSWLFCEEDRLIKPVLQRSMIDGIEKASGRSVSVTKIKAGHCVNISQEKATNKWALDLLSQLD